LASSALADEYSRKVIGGHDGSISSFRRSPRIASDSCSRPSSQILTRDAGFVWLGMALVIWLVISAVLEQGERALMSHAFMHRSVGVYPFNLLEHGQMTAGTVEIALSSLHQLIGVALLLAAVFYLGRTKNKVQTA
jgi:hypothetical protein